MQKRASGGLPQSTDRLVGNSKWSANQLNSDIQFESGAQPRLFDLSRGKNSRRIFVTLPRLDAYYILVAADLAAAKFRVVDGCYRNEDLPRSWLRLAEGFEAFGRATPPDKEGEGKWHVKTQF